MAETPRTADVERMKKMRKSPYRIAEDRQTTAGIADHRPL
jgi:hypothetical protein